MKEVDFEKYCQLCSYKNLGPYEEPCFTCIGRPVQEFSKKPCKFKRSDSKKKHANK